MRDFMLFAALLLILLIVGVITVMARADTVMRILEPRDTMVGTLERHFQVRPGQTRVLQECGCTVRYLGTTVHGRRYTVTIERLD